MEWKPPEKKPLKMSTADDDLRAHASGEADRLFGHPSAERAGQAERMASLRVAAAVFARMIEDVAPPTVDRTLAIREVRGAYNRACDAIRFEAEEESAYYAARWTGKGA